MKAVFFLLCTLGAASAILIKANQEHVFSYSGKILTGIPELDQTYSGIAIDASVILQAGANNDPFNNMYKLALREVKIANFNEKLNGAKPLNWRHMEVPSTSPVPEAFKAFLESPVEIELEAGEVKKVILSSEEPEWSVNFKKALVSVLKVRLPAEKAMSNMITRGQDMIPDSWSVMEQGIDGVCMNLYQVTEVPAHLAREMEQKLMKPELCQGMKMFEIVRNRDLTQCTVNSLYIASRQHENCLVGNCEGVTGKSTETRFLGCGEHKDAVTLHLVINEGELQQNLLAFNTEKVVTGTKQMLVLREVKSTKTVLPAIAAPRTVEDVVYEYPKEVTPEERMQVTNFKKQQEFYRNKAQDPSNLLITPSARLVAMDQQMKTKIVEKVRETARYLEEIENFGDKKAPSHLKSLQNALSFLKKEEIKSIFSEVKDRKVERSVFMEALLMAGTNPTIMFAKEMIMSKELTDMETAQVMITLPHYIKMPTPKLIEELFELISHPAVTVNPVIKSNAYIAFATIVRKACFPSAKPRAVFPRMVVGDVCDPNDVRITEKYIPYLVAELRKIDQPQVQGVMLALGAIGHPSVLPVLLPYIEGKVPTADIAIRKVAIYALSPVAQKYRNVLLPVLSARLHDQGEHTGVRVAAFTTMLSMEPRLVDWQRIAISSWYEKDDKMARFVFFTLQSLAQMKESEIAANSKLMDLTLKAKSVFPLAKPIPGIHSITYGEFVNRLMKDLGISYQTYETQMRYQHSMDYFYKLDFFLKNVRETRFEEYWASGGFHTFIIDAFQAAISSSNPKMHDEMRKVMEQLEITPKQESVMWVDQWFRLYDDMTLSIQSPRLGIQDVKEKMREVLTNSPKWIEEVKSTLCGKTPFHMIKAHQTMPYMAMVPSDMGFPIWIETEVTYLNSLKGEVDVDCSMTLPALDVKMTPKFSYAWSSYAGVVSPFTMELLAAGVSSHRAVNIPVRTEIRIEPTTGTLKIDMKHVDEVTAQTASVDIHHLHVIPFTTKKPFNFVDLTPIAADMRNTKILQSVSPKKTFETRMGERLGLDIKLQVESECDVLDKKTVMDTMNRYNYHPFHYWMFMATETAQKLDGSPTLRYHKYTLVHNPRDSTTKEMKAEIKLSGALKYKEGEIVKHIPSGSEKKTLQEQKLSRSIQELTSVDDVQATNVLMEIALIGGAPKTYEVSLTAAHGFSELNNKWNLHLEMEKDTPRMVCIAGVMERNVQSKVMYNNRLGFGSSCDEHFVIVEGMVASTDRQRELSRNTEEARRCDRLSRKIQEKQEQIKTLPQSSRKASLLEELAQMRIERMSMCEEKLRQRTALDRVEMTVTPSPNLPTPVYTAAKYLDTILKAVLVEYMAALPAPHSVTDPKVKVVIDIDQRTKSLNMAVTSPMDITQYKNIRVPGVIRNFLPVTLSKSPIEQLYQGFGGTRLYPKCSIFQGQIKTFDSMTYSYDLDDCYHLVSSECYKNSYAVLAKNKDNVKHVIMYHEDTKIELKEAASRYQSSRSPYEIFVDGERKEVRPDELLVFLSKDRQHKYSAEWSNNKITVDTPAHRVQYDGKELSVEDKFIVSIPHCGLCGDDDQDKRGDLKSADQCVYRSIKAMAQSFRIEDSECVSEIPPRDKQVLQEEKRLCTLSKTVQPQPQSAPSVLKENIQSVRKHLILHRSRDICISKMMQPQCPHDSLPMQQEKVTAEFVCVPSNSPKTKDWIHAIERMEEIPELSSMAASFSSSVSVSRSCSRGM